MIIVETHRENQLATDECRKPYSRYQPPGIGTRMQACDT